MTRTEASNNKRELLESSMMEVVVVKMRTGRPREKREKGSRVYVCVGEREGEEETTGLLSALRCFVFFSLAEEEAPLSPTHLRAPVLHRPPPLTPVPPPPPNSFMPSRPAPRLSGFLAGSRLLLCADKWLRLPACECLRR